MDLDSVTLEQSRVTVNTDFANPKVIVLIVLLKLLSILLSLNINMNNHFRVHEQV
jgi:hypothetical protein